jgi:hypothetical protein
MTMMIMIVNHNKVRYVLLLFYCNYNNIILLFNIYSTNFWINQKKYIKVEKYISSLSSFLKLLFVLSTQKQQNIYIYKIDCYYYLNFKRI